VRDALAQRSMRIHICNGRRIDSGPGGISVYEHEEGSIIEGEHGIDEMLSESNENGTTVFASPTVGGR
jgi:hypothetical protein